ncbi:VanW family protein [Parablautia sp. Marseille-Q6255]|uniref:VanW family protein n=1 Tax=Parablautia sp. Marseille-Q6255 TaxID=3039593 RepID=UPI0024BD06DE|nr:VanW family protein [Parablautia sp. Marseille-Q6255]
MKNKWNIAAGAAVLLLCGLGSAVYASSGESVISEGVFIGDKDVSGMTPEEAQEYVESEVEKLSSSVITIQMGDSTVSKSWGELGLKWDNPELIEEISQLGQTGNIVRRYKEQKDLQNQSAKYEIEYELDEEAQEAFVESCAQFNSEPVEGTCYVGEDGGLHVEGGTDGLTLDAQATLASLQEEMSDYEAGDRTVEAIVDRVSPVVTAELLEQMDDVLGSATTDYSASSAGRAKNVENGVSKLNGTLLLPGESFSVTDAVVPFTAENGYELAPSYEAGQVVDSYGGGICQVSTTLYNALLKSEVQIDARSNHTMIVNYVDPSKDAAIAEGVMDLAFTNTLEYPIYISGSAYAGTLNFTIFGVETRPANRSIEFVSETTGQTDPAQNIKLVAKTDQNVGYLAQVQSPHQGLSAVLWKNIYYDGVLSETIQVNSSNYQASPAIYEVGVVTDNQALATALYGAIGQNNLSQVQSILANGVQPQTEAPQSETTQTDAPQTDAPQTDAPQTEAPQTNAPQTDAPQADPPEVWDEGGVTVIG